MQRRRFQFMLFILLFSILWPVLSYAQTSTPSVVVLHTSTSDQGIDNGLLVRSYFTLRDMNGDPILKRDVKLRNEGTINLIGDNRSVRAAISEPDAPIKIVLLLDASGSMRNNLDVARDAALQALDSAPERAQFFIYQFTTLDVNTRLGSAESFSSNRQFWRSEVSAWRSAPGAGTCLYNAAFQAVQLLADSAQPEERRAVILFTDGVDELSGGGQCSERGAENVILRAKDKGIPIYTIGLCASQSCRSIDEAVLSRMARDTNGAAVVGVADQLKDRFSEIMQILDSQWVAKATLYPRSGPNTAALQVQVEGSDQTILGTFVVKADFDYYPPPTFKPVASYDNAADQYTLNLDPSNIQALGGVTLMIKDMDAGTQQNKLNLALDQLQSAIPIPTTSFQSGHQYCFQIQATNRDGQAFQLGPQEVENGADPTILASTCVKYEPSLQVVVDSVTPNWEAKKLLIQLVMRGLGQHPLPFQLSITTNSGKNVINLPGIVPDSQAQILIDIPPDLYRAGAQDEFMLKLRTEANGQPLDTEYSFKITPKPGLNPIWLWLIGVVLLAVVGILGWRGYLMWRTRQPTALPGPRVYTELTGRVNGSHASPPLQSGQRTKQVRVRVLKTKDPTQKLDVLVDTFPFIIGRSEKKGINLPILGDTDISRTHLQIRLQGADVTVIDLNSANGTFITGRQLQPNQAEVLRTTTQVQLGPNTVIEISMM
ncbi:FHA domain-containing protein [Candidatus Oscillochloris fontis]|uniref:FHA domain-containing protein n=1 Tax=Candidatus Oscillochloris fontis TaxID=2496868 RepID=UPI00101C3881|nr:FHA domain-containing protein [Candidatus Oscillochloris fontis]